MDKFTKKTLALTEIAIFFPPLCSVNKSWRLESLRHLNTKTIPPTGMNTKSNFNPNRARVEDDDGKGIKGFPIAEIIYNK